MTMKIAVLSDTHGLLRPEVRTVIRDCDAVIHAGDIDSEKILDEIEKEKKTDAPFFAVRGNCDGEWAKKLPLSEKFSLGGWNFYLTHRKKDVPEDLGDRQVIVFGHSHKFSEKVKDGRLWLNPGSCGKRRFRDEITMAVLCLEETEWTVKRLDVSRGSEELGTGRNETAEIPSEDLLKRIEKILKKMDKGQQVSRIAADLGLDEAFVAQICRIRVTHPGVTAHGILDKVEVNRTGR